MPAASERTTTPTDDQLRRLGRLRRDWEWTTAGRRWHSHWQPAQALFLLVVAPVILLLPLDLPEAWPGFATWRLPGTVLGTTWCLVLAGNALLNFRILRWRWQRRSPLWHRVTWVALASVPLVGFFFLAQRSRERDEEPTPPIPRPRAPRLSPPDRLACWVDRLADLLDEPLLQICWLWALNILMLLSTSGWIAAHSAPFVREAASWTLHGTAAMAIFFDDRRPWRREIFLRSLLATLALLPGLFVWVAVALVLLLTWRWDHPGPCTEAHATVTSMRRFGDWESLGRLLQLNWRRTPWRLRPAIRRPASLGSRQTERIETLQRLKTALLPCEALLVGFLWQSNGGAGLDLVHRGAWLLAATAGAGWFFELSIRVAETLRLVRRRARRPIFGMASLAFSLVAYGLLCGRSIALADETPVRIAGLSAMVVALLLMVLGFGLVLVGFSRALADERQRLRQAPWLLFLFALEAWLAWASTAPHIAWSTLLWTLYAAPLLLLADLAAGLAYRFWLFRPLGSTPAGHRFLGLAVAWSSLVPGGGLALPAWWRLSGVDAEAPP